MGNVYTVEYAVGGRKHCASSAGHERCTLKVVQPGRLIVMFRSQRERVQKDQNNDDPVERLGLDSLATGTP